MKNALAHVGDWLKAHTQAYANADLVLLDPPRSGADAATINGLLALRPRHIAYVSCACTHLMIKHTSPREDFFIYPGQAERKLYTPLL